MIKVHSDKTDNPCGINLGKEIKVDFSDLKKVLDKMEKEYADKKYCFWNNTKDRDYIEYTSCNNMYYFREGENIKKTNIKFCPYCGKEIKIKNKRGKK